MRVTFPHMGTMSLAMQALLENLQLDVVTPPPITSRTMMLGAKHCPECVCLPFKVNVGNFIEAIELGADTIVTSGGTGPCRLGYYAEVQSEILRDLGFDIKMVVLEPPQGDLATLLRNIALLSNKSQLLGALPAAYFAWRLSKALDNVEKRLYRLRAVEVFAGTCDKVWTEALKTIGQARTLKNLRDTEAYINEKLSAVRVHGDRVPLQVGIVGEMYMLLEPAVNLRLTERLGMLGVEVHRSMYVSDWVSQHLVPGRSAAAFAKKIKEAARPFLRGTVGGHGLQSVGHSVLYAEEGLHGIVQVLPLTCMPEIVAQSILPSISEKYGVPIITLILDEHAGEAGLQTRLEAFVDMLQARQLQRRDIVGFSH